MVSVDHPDKRYSGRSFVLAFFWFSGLLCGVLCYPSADDSLILLMHGVPSSAVTIVSLLLPAILPFLLSACAALCFRPVFLLLQCFAKAFLLAYVSFGLLQAYGSAGWLIRSLLSFDCCFSAPVIYMFWLHCFSGLRKFCVWEFLLDLALLFLIESIHYCIISPFLARLIIF